VPIFLTSPQVRPFIRSIIERFRTQAVIMPQNEIPASVRLRTLGTV
jgi:flagellar biosynthesis protein FlhA